MTVSLTRSVCLSATALTLVCAVPATAQLPDPVRAMIDAAIASGDPIKVNAVVDIAKTTNPDDASEIEALVSPFVAEEEKRAAEALVVAKLAEEKAAADAKAAEEKAAALAAAEEEAAIRNAGLFDNWTGEGQIGGFRSTGNSKNNGFTAGIKLARQGIKWRHNITALADTQTTNGTKSREQFLFAYEPNYDLNDRVYLFGLAQYERDKFQGFSSRYAVSGGFGYRAIEEDDMTLSIKAGPAWRKTNFLPTGNETALAGLAALDFDWQMSKALKVTHDASAFLQSGNSSFLSTTGLEAALGSNLSARLSYAIEHDTNPPAGAVKTDTLSRFTLIYGF